MTRRARLADASTLALAAVPAALVVASILWFGVNVPHWDDWDVSPIFLHYRKRAPSPSAICSRRRTSRGRWCRGW